MDYGSDSRTRRLFALDLLRGVAILLVLIRHMPVRPRPREGVSEFILEALTRVGWTGVDLFFVLSGFLISGLLFQEYDRTGGLDVKKFWLRRGFKIWPAYFAAYGLTMAALSFAGAAATAHPADALNSWRYAWPNLVFVQNYLPEVYRWPHSWSLAVEEHFYLALPICLALFARLSSRRRAAGTRGRFEGLPLACAAVCAATLLLRVLLSQRAGTTVSHLYYPTHVRADALCFGVLLGYTYRYRRELFARIARQRTALLLAAPLLLVIAVVLPLEKSGFTQTAGLTVFYLAYGGLVVIAADRPDWGRTGPRPFVWAARSLAALGVYSYTTYLAHSVVYRLPGIRFVRGWVFDLLGERVWSDRLLFWALSIGGGVLLSHLCERPFLRLRSRLLPRNARENYERGGQGLPARDAPCAGAATASAAGSGAGENVVR